MSLYEQQLRMRQAENQLSQATHEGMMSAFDALAKWGGIKMKLGKKYSEQMAKITDNGSALSQADYDHVTSKVADGQDTYINAPDKQTQAKELGNLQKIGRDFEKYDGDISQFAEAYEKGDVSDAIHHDESGIAFLDYIAVDNGKPKLFEKECEGDCENKGEWGVYQPDFELMSYNKDRLNEINEKISTLEQSYEIDGISGDGTELDALINERDMLTRMLDQDVKIWRSIQWVNKTAEHWKKDKSTPKVLQSYAEQALSSAANSNPDDNPQFEEEKFRQLLSGKIFGGETPGKIHSMIYDEMIDGRVFRNDFINMIQGQIGTGTNIGNTTYASLGITDDQLRGFDVNTDDIIDPDEATLIADTLLKDKNAAMDYLTEYFMGHFKNNFDIGLKKNRPPVLEEEDEKEDDNENNVVEKRKNREDITPATTINTEYS